MEKNRLEAFSDGVLAIIITIMVLELKLPESDTWKDLLKLTPTLLAYLLSFFFVAIYWVNHHITFHDVEQVNLKILWCNIVWLFVMSFIPFATAWVGQHPSSQAPLSFYFADMSLACIAFHLMYYFIFKENHCGNHFSLEARSIASLIVYTGAAIFCGLCPVAAFIAVAVVSFWWVIPIKTKK
ncbi:MAG: TMEM175 family protein [Eubacterium sp.]|nr:TMEM175 family protein [Eubacterium sp.]